MVEKQQAEVKEVLEEETSGNPFVEKFEEFFKTAKYKREIEKLVGNYPEKRSLFIDFTDLEHFDPTGLADELLENPDYVLEAASEAIKRIDVPALEIESFEPHIRVFNIPKEKQPLIRDISAEHLNKLVAVEGVVRQFNEVQPKLKIAVWKCRRCGNTYNLEQEGFQVRMPSFCECRHKDFELLEEKSFFVNHQKIAVQEPLENLKGGEQANSLDIHVTDDLVNKVSPGDKTLIVGVLRLYPPSKERKLVFGRYLDALSIEEKQIEFGEVEISKEEEAEIKKLAKRKNVYDLLVNSIAPSIYGHEIVKEAIALQLFSGVKKLLPGEMKVRGNIHVLLVGDPGLAKSQLLQAVNTIAPKSIYTAGKTTSSVGLTASAERDEFGEGGWTLKAGALVLASGGMAMIDEFDKMDPEDRSAMHEAMEQSQVSIAKAGIVTTFRTDTSILAAANPKYARFDPYSSPLEQVELPASLISRFDLFFLMKDIMDRKKDEAIASFILKRHQAGEQDLSSKSKGKKIKEGEVEEEAIPISRSLLKKYISFARQKVFPVMTDEAMKNIMEFYLNLRDIGRREGQYTATHRQLEALVRLSEASARVKLKETVDNEDTERAIRIFRTSMEELALDKDTGKIDIDIITSGRPHSKTENILKIMHIVKELSDSGKQTISLDEVIKEAVAEGISVEKIEELIRELKKKGEIYEPRHGFIKPTEKRE